MKDVAKLAGVSQTTVSFVFNDMPDMGIPDETKERVWEAVKELGYRPNILAQNLRRQRSGLLGFITDEIATTPYAGKIIEGAQDIAWEHGKILLMVNTKDNQEIKDAAIEMLLKHQVEGIIYATMYHRSVNIPDTLREVPTVLLDCYVEDRSLPSVVPEEEEGAFAATQYLIEKGHRRIGFINHRVDIPATRMRLEGYKKALKKVNIPLDDDLIRLVEADAETEGAYDQTMALMQLSEPPTAIFSFNDRTALGTYDALRKLGLDIPKDVAVMGFDNQELISARLYPPLSTMELPHYRMGEWAANKLIKLINGEDDNLLIQHKLGCPLVERKSV